MPAEDRELSAPAGPECSRWGDGARALAEQVGGRWPEDAPRQVLLCQLVHFRPGPEGDRWVVDDPVRFAKVAGARVSGDYIQPSLDLPAAAGDGGKARNSPLRPTKRARR